MPLTAKVLRKVGDHPHRDFLEITGGEKTLEIPVYQDLENLKRYKLHYLDGDTNREKSIEIEAKDDGVYVVNRGTFSRQKKLVGDELDKLFDLVANPRLMLTDINGCRHRIPVEYDDKGRGYLALHSDQRNLEPGKVKYSVISRDEKSGLSIQNRMLLDEVAPAISWRPNLKEAPDRTLPVRNATVGVRIPIVEIDPKTKRIRYDDYLLRFTERGEPLLGDRNGSFRPMNKQDLDQLDKELARTYTILLCHPEEVGAKKSERAEFAKSSGGDAEYGPFVFKYKGVELIGVDVQYNDNDKLVVQSVMRSLSYPDTVSGLKQQIDRMVAVKERFGEVVRYSHFNGVRGGFIGDPKPGDYVIMPGKPGEGTSLQIRICMHPDHERQSQVNIIPCEWDEKQKRLKIGNVTLPKDVDNLNDYVQQYVELKKHFGDKAHFVARTDKQDFYVTPGKQGKAMLHEGGKKYEIPAKNVRLLGENSELSRLIADIQMGSGNIISLSQSGIDREKIKKCALKEGLKAAKDELFLQIENKLKSGELEPNVATALRRAHVMRQLMHAKGEYRYKDNDWDKVKKDADKNKKPTEKNLLRLLYLYEMWPTGQSEVRKGFLKEARKIFKELSLDEQRVIKERFKGNIFSDEIKTDVFGEKIVMKKDKNNTGMSTLDGVSTLPTIDYKDLAKVGMFGGGASSRGGSRRSVSSPSTSSSTSSRGDDESVIPSPPPSPSTTPRGGRGK